MILIFGALLQGTPASAGLVLNEILYDPEGPDEGAEFVELWNSDSIAVALEGVAVESGDGSRPGTWVTIFTGAATDTVAPHRSTTVLICFGFPFWTRIELPARK